MIRKEKPTNVVRRIFIFSLFWLSFIGYFIIPLLIDSIPCPVLFIQIDDSIPFIWWMIIPYYLYYIFILIPPFIIHNENKVKLLTRILIQTSILCYIIYIIWPITSSNILISVKDNPLSFLHNSITFNYLHQNAFPSMHVAVSVIIGLVISLENKKWKNLTMITMFLIFLSTFLVKQHYIADSVGGLIIGYVGYYQYKKYKNFIL